MKKLASIFLSSLVMFSCSNNTTTIIPNLDNEIQASSVKNTVSISKILAKKTKSQALKVNLNAPKLKNNFKFVETKKVNLTNTKNNLKVSQIHMDSLRNAILAMDKTSDYADGVEIGRNTAHSVMNDLINNNDSNYIFIHTLFDSLTLERVQSQQPTEYDNSSVFHEYLALHYAFEFLLKAGNSLESKYLALYSYNVMVNINNDSTYNDSLKKRNAFYIGSQAVYSYSQEDSFSDYKKLAQDTLNSIDNANSLNQQFETTIKFLDVVSG
ncbi:MAG: hypothetical protein U0457_12140 [Candidatus Sericytochromatia bacterium]